MPLVSVIIPCYNQAQFLHSAIESVLASTMQDFEIIVVDDGSTAPESKRILRELNMPKTTVINQQNMGLVGARNTGIRYARGKYILPLDSDDKISNRFLELATQFMESHKNYGIVGGKTELFGAKSGVWDLPKYSWPDILKENLLVCTNMFRRSDWVRVGGYNPNMKYGLEDWNFWLDIISLGREVYQFDDVLFYYRKHSESMITNIQENRRQQMKNQIIANHLETYKKYPMIMQRVSGNLSVGTRLQDFFVRMICLLIPYQPYRHKIKDFFRYR